MMMGVAESLTCLSAYPELAGARVMITGLEAGHGVDIARAFAEAGCRLVVQTPSVNPELDGVLEVLAQSAADIEVSDAPIRDAGEALRFAQSAVTTFGGLDIVVNLARLDVSGLSEHATPEEIEDRLTSTLARPFRITEVIANRMHLTWTDGLILNIVTQQTPKSRADLQLGQIAKSALAALTRQIARQWADREIRVRVNAIAPDANLLGVLVGGGDRLTTEPEIAALALHLAGDRGREMSGLVFDAACT